MNILRIHPSERGLLAEEFCTAARALDSVVHHPPCVFIKSDTRGDALGWAISLFSQTHQEPVYLVSQRQDLKLFPDLQEAMVFLKREHIFTFSVSSAG